MSDAATLPTDPAPLWTIFDWTPERRAKDLVPDTQ